MEIFDCVLCNIFSFWLSLAVICHTNNTYYFIRVIDGVVSCIREGVSANFKCRLMVQGHSEYK